MSRELWDENFDVKKEKVFCSECVYYREDTYSITNCLAYEKIWIEDNPIYRGRYVEECLELEPLVDNKNNDCKYYEAKQTIR